MKRHRELTWLLLIVVAAGVSSRCLKRTDPTTGAVISARPVVPPAHTRPRLPELQKSPFAGCWSGQDQHGTVTWWFNADGSAGWDGEGPTMVSLWKDTDDGLELIHPRGPIRGVLRGNLLIGCDNSGKRYFTLEHVANPPSDIAGRWTGTGPLCGDWSADFSECKSMEYRGETITYGHWGTTKHGRQVTFWLCDPESKSKYSSWLATVHGSTMEGEASNEDGDRWTFSAQKIDP